MGVLFDALSERIRTSLRLPPVPRKLYQPLSNEAYFAHFDFAGRLISANNFRNDVFHRGFRPHLGPHVSLLLLGIFPRDLSLYQSEYFLTDSCELYYRLKMQLLLVMQSGHAMEKFKIIRADVDDLEDVEEANKTHLYEMLCTFLMAFPSIGYHKGMAPVANVMLNLFGEEACAYLGFCSHMKRASKKFSNPALLEKQFEKVMDLLAFFDPFLALRLKNFEEELFSQAVRHWLLFDLALEFPKKDIQRVLEMQWALCTNLREKGTPLNETTTLESPSKQSSNHVAKWLFGDVESQSMLLSENTAAPSCDEGISLEGTCFQMPSTVPSTKKSFTQTVSSIFTSSRSRRFSVSSYMSSASKVQFPSTHGRKTFVVSNKSPPLIALDDAVTNPFLLFLCTAILIENRDLLLQATSEGSNPSFLGLGDNKASRFQAGVILPRAIHLLKLYLYENRRTVPVWSSFLR